jgi:RNA polymerase sigma-70 factor (ECF subfamily)
LESLQKFQTDIIKQCKSNNRKAQIQLYETYCDAMFAVAMRFLRNSDDAEDVLQESFLKAFQKIEQFKGEVTFGAWLKRIVVHSCIDFLKAKHHEYIPLDENLIHFADDDDWEVTIPITIDEVRLEILGISEKYRFVLLLYLIEGYDHSEISEILHIPEATCRTHLLRGKAILKEKLAKKKIR